MKIRILMAAVFVAISSFATAQEKKENGRPTPEQMIEWRVKKAEKGLMLDDAKSAQFASIYKEYLLEKAKCRPEIVRGKELTDADIKKNIKSRMDAKQKSLDIDKKYFGKLEKILNAKQLHKIFSNKGDAPRMGKRGFAKRMKSGDKAMKGDASRMGKRGFAPRAMNGGGDKSNPVCK